MPYVNSQIKAQGVSFRHYFVSQSLCCPSRAATLTGQYAHNNGVLNNGEGSFQRGGFKAAQQHHLARATVATSLQQAGYHTALVGKYLNGYPGSDKLTLVPRGWNDWYSPSAGTPYNNFNYTLNENGVLKRYGSRPKDYGTDVYASIAAKIIRSASARDVPFFIYFAPFAPHVPDIPAPRFRHTFAHAKAPRGPAFNEKDVSDKPEFIRRRKRFSPGLIANIDDLYRRRLQTVQAVDEAAKSLITVLRETGELKNTYIVFASDNGYHLGQHRLPGGKRAAYETDIHLPLFVRGPGVPAGVSRGALVGNIDLAPSFAALGHARMPDLVDGRSFVAVLTSAKAGGGRRSFLLEHWTEGKLRHKAAQRGVDEPYDHDRYENPTRAHPFIVGKRVPVNPELELPPLIAEAKGIPSYYGLRTARYAFVAYSTGEKELYDLWKDPYELDNLGRQQTYQPLLGRLQQRAKALRTCRAASCRRLENAALGDSW